MKAILMSIKHKWCELIFSGEKTVEVRKIAPKLKPPFKVYVYESIGQGEGAGAVVGEFVCDRAEKYEHFIPYDIDDELQYSISQDSLISSCLEPYELTEYGNGKLLHGLHITSPKRYDTPKELEAFWTVRCTNKTGECETCEVKPACISNVTRPPQSWMYIVEIEE